jgi:hypothetical protein
MVSVSRLFPQLRGLCLREEFINLSLGVSLVGDHLGCICGTLLIALDNGSPWEQAVCHLIPEYIEFTSLHPSIDTMASLHGVPLCGVLFGSLMAFGTKELAPVKDYHLISCKGHYCWMTALMYNNFGVLVTEMRGVHGRWSNL